MENHYLIEKVCPDIIKVLYPMFLPSLRSFNLSQRVLSSVNKQTKKIKSECKEIQNEKEEYSYKPFGTWITSSSKDVKETTKLT